MSNVGPPTVRHLTRMAMRQYKNHLLFIVLLGVVVAAGCGGDEAGTATVPEQDSEDNFDGGQLDQTTSSDGVSLCIDRDGDGYGEGCDLGFDCNDGASHIYDGAVELCDFVDNDCDGDVDEECPCIEGTISPCYTGPIGTLGVGRCSAGWQMCEGGDWTDCRSELVPRDEDCDSLDNDCNGLVDEGLTNACGQCGGTPEEVCGDGLDNDCNGVIDDVEAGCDCDGRENQVCYSGPPNTLGVGSCRGGTFDCVDDAWGPCRGEVIPSAEACDGIDNDCDGLIDEGLTNACGECGVVTARETCDGVDNDCDGLIDEGLVLLCGLCSAEGLEEICGDGLDNDCDTFVDEACACEGEAACYPGSAATRNVGACEDGTRGCDSSGEFWGPCGGAVLPQPEICDGLDNDCDGFVDISPAGCNLCTRNVEECDNVDNDCDGAIDEYLRNSCGQCIDAVEGEALCDGLDNDCDGLVDEGLLNACGECGDSCYVEDWSVAGGNLDEGESNGLDADLSEGLRLGSEPYVYPFLWVANDGDSTVSRVNTEDPTQPIQTVGVGSRPSRTAVDLDGNVWVINRAFGGQGSVTKILAENESGDAEVLFTANIGGNNHIPRGVAIDADNNAWVGTYNPGALYQLRNSDGGILFQTTIDVSVYGLAIDSEGTLWISNINGNIGRFNTDTRTMDGIYPDDRFRMPSGVCLQPYGIAVDGDGHVWVGNWTCNNLVEFDPDNGFRVYTPPGGDASRMGQTRGVAVDDHGRVWVSGYGSSVVGRFDPSTSTWRVSNTCSGPIGIGVSGNGTVWSPCHTSNNVTYFDEDVNQLGTVSVGSNPYSYSDMTGFQLRTFTARLGTWTVTYDCGRSNCTFDKVEWESTELAGSEVQVRARSSVDGATWSARVGAFRVSPASLAALPDGRYVEIEVSLRGGEDDISPVVRSVEVHWQRP